MTAVYLYFAVGVGVGIAEWKFNRWGKWSRRALVSEFVVSCLFWPLKIWR